METLTATAPHRIKRKLIKHTPAYVETVGKTDMETLARLGDEVDGKGTVLRLIMGATEKMPVRALSYVSSALKIAEVIPFEQLQIVHANNLGCEVNGLCPDTVHEQSLMLAHMASLLVAGQKPALAKRVLHAEDTAFDLSPFVPLAQVALDTNGTLETTLSRQAQKHHGEHVAYTAAHCAFQDTDSLRLRPLIGSEAAPRQVPAERIVSIGCQSERTFYQARMAMRQLTSDVDFVDTAQIFTLHVVPPYFMARGGEVALEDALNDGFNIDGVRDIAARRDIDHFISVLNQEGV